MHVKLRIEIATGVMHEHRAGKISRQPKRFGVSCIPAPLAHGGEVLHLDEHRSHGLDERLAHPLVLADHREHAHILRGGNLNIE